jgi:hypothetical protein
MLYLLCISPYSDLGGPQEGKSYSQLAGHEIKAAVNILVVYYCRSDSGDQSFMCF